ncbi:hypothetical protein BCR32DRAFT_273109 [Anaeromyces robustus]|uniref:Uncharacterized protein n=1 Tax=Anaeromyces robustus TaxID=1754192 RepID=A0A1Y1VUK3_9FUNG|nr:hypothetical protein BCR32DRAFT_273109 [Anaeromyces robustus]|eukprot:ORX64434.1 hypothetical protein BCR32DRAFT_273109 [Anaeromyces robustus]
MVFKVFCDVNVSCITNEDIYDNEGISYDFIPKFDDNKENWDPKASKKNSSNSVESVNSIISKKVDKKDDKKEKSISMPINSEEAIGIKINNEKEEKEINEQKIKCQEEKEHSNKEKGKEKDRIESKPNEKDDLKKDISKAVESPSSSNDTTKLNNEEESNSSVVLQRKSSLLGKRERIPLEDITYLFVPEKRRIVPKRARVVKNEVESSSSQITISVKKNDKSISLKENKESMKSHNIYSGNSKENVKPNRKTPLSNISNRSNININNNTHTNTSKLNNNSIPKPFFVNVKKNKSIKRNIIIPKKALKSKQNSYNVSARMLR